MMCVVHWKDTLLGSADYYNDCNFNGIPSFRPPPGYPDGQACVGFYSANGGGEKLSTCIDNPLMTGVSYQLSAYFGYNEDNGVPTFPSPATVVLYGKIENCDLTYVNNGFCPVPMGYDSIASITFIYTDEVGWVYGESECFEVDQEYNHFVIGAPCNATSNGYYFLDLFKLLPCGGEPIINFVLGTSCGDRADGFIDLTISGSIPPYTFDWDIDGTGDFDDEEDQDSLGAGGYTITVMAANGLQQCLNIRLPQILPEVPIFGDIGPLCLGAPSVIFPTTSLNFIPITGTWDPAIVQTDVVGFFDFYFYPDTSFCADTIMQTVEIIRLATDTGFVTYEGCEGDGYQIIINGSIYSQANPTGQQIINTTDVCDSVIDINLNFTPNTLEWFQHASCTQSGYSITINSNTYDESNPIGTEMLVSQNNCDSTVNIDLIFLPFGEGSVSEVFCAGSGEEVVVNNVTYNESNPTGTETISVTNRCDSIVTIDLFYYPITTTPITYSGCFGDGYSITINGTIYDEYNPAGSESMTNILGCDSIVTINLTFADAYQQNEEYTGCLGDGYSIVVNNVIYDESNPTGVENLVNAMGCDTTVMINLIFTDEITDTITYSGCIGDGHEIIVNDTLYNEINPLGVQRMISVGGCDSVVTVDLQFSDGISDTLSHSGCVGDGYAVTVNNVLYNETNPIGIERMSSARGCDSSVQIILEFNHEFSDTLLYIGCLGDGYSVTVNGVNYDETNRNGRQQMASVSGCDSIIVIDLEFNLSINDTIYHIGCLGDGYMVIVNNVLYDENNRTGQERMTTVSGCDSVVNVSLAFGNEINEVASHVGCTGDGYSIRINHVLYDETNPTGLERMTTTAGCDSVVTVNLQFNAQILETISHMGCMGDGYSITINNVVYDETNPSGIERMTTSAGCDSVVNINLEFGDETMETASHGGCVGDGYSILINSVLYNESNPTGTERMTTAQGCDSVVTINLIFSNEIFAPINYRGCENDGYEITINNSTYNETNPNGQEIIPSNSGCDSVIDVSLQFLRAVDHIENYSGCSNDGFVIIVNGNIYDELNPNGQELLVSSNGCDSIVIIDLEFLTVVDIVIEHVGCENDGYSLTINGTTYDENNPAGIEMIDGGLACDSIIHIEFSFLPQSTFSQNIQFPNLLNPVINLLNYLPAIGSFSLIEITPSILVSCQNCLQPVFTGQESAILNITIIDQNGCMHSGTINVLVESTSAIFIPSVFSPNNDGINDYFQFFTKPHSPRLIKSFDIFNRWGDKVFSRHSLSTDDAATSWDGTVRGRPSADGVYVYVIELFVGNTDEGELVRMYGDVTLMR